jgi:CRISPR-associated endonuclease Csy4
MKFYQQVQLLPGAEVELHFIFKKVYQQIHLALVENKKDDNSSSVGISFPEYDAEKKTVGSIIRLFSTEEEALKKIDLDYWLNRLRDYVHVKSIREVPLPFKIRGYAFYCRRHMKGSNENLARRHVKRKSVTLDEARLHYSNFERKFLFPYFQVESMGNGNTFRLFVERIACDENHIGTFSCYGLSKGATVPEF